MIKGSKGIIVLSKKIKEKNMIKVGILWQTAVRRLKDLQ